MIVKELQEVKSAEAVAAEERHRARLAATAATEAEEERQTLRVETEKTEQKAAASQMQRNLSDAVTQREQQHPPRRLGSPSPSSVQEQNPQSPATPSMTGEQQCPASGAGMLIPRPVYWGRSRSAPDVPLPRQSILDGKGSWEASTVIRFFGTLLWMVRG